MASESPLCRWKSNSPKFPTISEVAKDIFAVQASSVASESVFSSANQFIDDNRSRLGDEILSAVTVLHSWQRFFGDRRLKQISSKFYHFPSFLVLLRFRFGSFPVLVRFWFDLNDYGSGMVSTFLESVQTRTEPCPCLTKPSHSASMSSIVCHSPFLKLVLSKSIRRIIHEFAYAVYFKFSQS